MPFCRECGKEVDDDWLTCPYCSVSLTTSSRNISIQDSAIVGDISINNQKEIIDATSKGYKRAIYELKKEKEQLEYEKARAKGC